jgi:hypothetical protein
MSQSPSDHWSEITDGSDLPLSQRYPDGLVDPNEHPIEVTDESEAMAEDDEGTRVPIASGDPMEVEPITIPDDGASESSDLVTKDLGNEWFEYFYFSNQVVKLCHPPEAFEILAAQGVEDRGHAEDQGRIMLDSHGIGWKVIKVFCQLCSELKDFKQMSVSGQWYAYRGLKMAKRDRCHAVKPVENSLGLILCKDCLQPSQSPSSDEEFLKQLASKEIVKVELSWHANIRMTKNNELFCRSSHHRSSITSGQYELIDKATWAEAAASFREMLSTGDCWNLPIPDSPTESSSAHSRHPADWSSHSSDGSVRVG